LYSRSNIFVNPSKEETFSMVTIEAMACKTKVIVLDTSAVKELVDEGTGIVLHNDSIQNYLDAIYKLSN
jgi:glycosyltransferase involved in cell wall biosynthesis